jgi:hypothetical protein
VKPQTSSTEKSNLAQFLAPGAFISTKKELWQAKNADFRQILSDPKIMTGDHIAPGHC